MPDPHAGDHWATDSYNLIILGKSQTGKTSVAREVHHTVPRSEEPRVSIWLNEAGRDRVGNVSGKVCRRLTGKNSVAEAFHNGEWTIEFVSDNRDRDIVALRKWLWDVADRADRQLPVTVITDEIHRIAPQSNTRDDPPRDAVRRFAKEGMKRNIKFVAITQSPISYDKESLRQAEYRLVFDMSAENQSAVSDYGFSFDVVGESDRHTAALHDASGNVLEPAVKADEQYA